MVYPANAPALPDPAPPDVLAWKKEQRQRLLQARQAIAAADRQAWNQAISQHLQTHFPQWATMTLGIYWPYLGEFDPRFVAAHFRALGGKTALPEVVQKAAPLRFKRWWPGVAMAPGVYDIPVPQGTETVQPDALLIPPVGFDAAGYRIGYGGGFYDRTLAAASPRPLTLGVAYEISRLPTIHPQAHDQPVDFLVTENGVFPTGKTLRN